VQIAIHHPNDVLFKTANATIFSRLVEGRFPRYQDVIPKSHEIAVELMAGQFHSVVRQAQIVTNEESRGVDFTFGDGLLVLTSQAADVGTSRVEMPISYTGPNLVIRFDPRFISDFLKVLAPETQVNFKLSTDEDPGVLSTEDGYTYVIMPLSREG
jgi:DNA polymerase-3 subunit beta